MGGADLGNGTFVGLDVHARSVVAGLIDEDTGEVRVTRAPHRTTQLVGWLCDLDGPVRVAYEAGPTGFGLVRACEAAGMQCLVAAPSLIARSPAGRGKKSDASDAEQLARLLRAGELTAVRVPDPTDEAARDLVRAREDARADLMRTRRARAGSPGRGRLPAPHERLAISTRKGGCGRDTGARQDADKATRQRGRPLSPRILPFSWSVTRTRKRISHAEAGSSRELYFHPYHRTQPERARVRWALVG